MDKLINLQIQHKKKEENNTVSLKQTEKDIKENNINNNEFICPECKKSLKNNSGLRLHMKVHEKNQFYIISTKMWKIYKFQSR